MFRIKLVFPEDFPSSPPKGYFLTKIYHPNISESGEICVNSLKKDWDPISWNLKNIFEVKLKKSFHKYNSYKFLNNLINFVKHLISKLLF